MNPCHSAALADAVSRWLLTAFYAVLGTLAIVMCALTIVNSLRPPRRRW